MQSKSQPVLVGTISVEVSELLSRMLCNANESCIALNAKHHESEAEIVARAGQMGAVTIATNMAGRGTDIKLYWSQEAGVSMSSVPNATTRARIDRQPADVAPARATRDRHDSTFPRRQSDDSSVPIESPESWKNSVSRKAKNWSIAS